MKVIKNCKIVLDDKIIDGNIFIENGKIHSISTGCDYLCDEEIDAAGMYVSPGFIDIHTHGAVGFDFAESNVDEIAKAVNFHMSHGTTSILPTITASKKGVILSALENIKACKNSGLAQANIIGAHLEGPYFSKEMCGAQNTDHITPPIKEDFEEIVKNHGDIISRWSYAPEHDPKGEFCRYITENGISPSAGHTMAKYGDMKIAMDNGLKSVTHLYSCTSTITREQGFRKLGVIETAFLHDELYAEIIADGKHLPPELIRLILKIKDSDKICLVTDSLSVAGTSEKTGEIGGTKYIMEDGVCKLLDRSAFAGSIATTDRLVRVCTQDVGIPLPQAIKMITKTPADLLGVNKGRIETGFDADLVIFNEDIDISLVMVDGDITYKSNN